MHFEDMTKYSYCFPPGLGIKEALNIGWLDGVHQFPRGHVPDDVLNKLQEIILGSNGNFNVHVNVIRGIHPCNICDEKVFILSMPTPYYLGSSEIWIPSCVLDQYFAAPSMVLHYMRDHGYLPPKEFIDSVIKFDAANEFNAQNVYEQLVKRSGYNG
jgi:hypothetical protein